MIELESVVSLAPSARLRASFSSLLEVRKTVAPCILAKASAKTETPPVPRIAIVSPALMRAASTTASHAVSAAQGKVAASSKLRCAGM